MYTFVNCTFFIVSLITNHVNYKLGFCSLRLFMEMYLLAPKLYFDYLSFMICIHSIMPNCTLAYL